jgi:hypothetical protein
MRLLKKLKARRTKVSKKVKDIFAKQSKPVTLVKTLAKRECANYGTWLTLECHSACLVEQSKRCVYFEKNVLPLAEQWKGEYRKLVKEGMK